MAIQKSPLKKAFEKIKLEINSLKKEQSKIRTQINDSTDIAEVKSELALLREKQEKETEKLKDKVAKNSTAEVKAELKELQKDVSKMKFDPLKEEVRELKTTVKDQKKEIKELRTIVEKFMKQDGISKRVDDLEEDIRERLDLYDKILQQNSVKNTKVNEDEAIEKFAAQHTHQDEKKGFGKWLFSKEK